MACHHVKVLRSRILTQFAQSSVLSGSKPSYQVKKSLPFQPCLLQSTNNIQPEQRGLILGVYEPETENDDMELSEAAEHIDISQSGRLLELLKISGGNLKAGKARVYHGIDEKYTSIAVVGLGKKSAGFNELEGLKDCKENVRTAVAAGVRALKDVNCIRVRVDPCGDAQAAAEGAFLSAFKYDELKSNSKQKPQMDLSLWINTGSNDHSHWITGRTYAKSQNFARKLMEMPANKLTPSIYGEMVSEKLVDACSSDPSKLTVRAHQQDWIERHEMGAFLSVAKGSSEPPLFLEVSYKGGASSEKPIVLVGKGITFDRSKHIQQSIWQQINVFWWNFYQAIPGDGSYEGRHGGAANVAGALWAALTLQLPVNVVGLVPLCENMPSGVANKPGDVVTAMNGKTIQNQRSLIDLATLTGAIDVALGSGATGVFSNNNNLSKALGACGVETGDRLWRMPLFHHFSKQVTESQLADLNNIGKYARSGGACTAAAFLHEFVTCPLWAHLDIAGVMQNKDEVPYLGKGMSGERLYKLDNFRVIIERFYKVGQKGISGKRDGKKNAAK
ncbi:putative cytosol aminopeptidase-like [Apostichopus japonicus]|uniref:Cytosol aminopeptidase n=1 Tax=Stichopus japonicus TaxID=307972 RepID=A0A2G8JBR5_STIJA|nr:putative cytosol aminopeptidase-like [Apostichopus japonicus]